MAAGTLLFQPQSNTHPVWLANDAARAKRLWICCCKSGRSCGRSCLSKAYCMASSGNRACLVRESHRPFLRLIPHTIGTQTRSTSSIYMGFEAVLPMREVSIPFLEWQGTLKRLASAVQLPWKVSPGYRRQQSVLSGPSCCT
jgi:hypothetical protein